MSEKGQMVATKRYNISSSDTTQRIDCSVSIDLVVSPAVYIGSGIADFLYGDGGQGEMQLNTLYQDPIGSCTHIELRTSPKPGRSIHEVFIMLERIDTYLNEVDKTDPNQLRRMRYLDPVNQEAAQRQSQGHVY